MRGFRSGVLTWINKYWGATVFTSDERFPAGNAIQIQPVFIIAGMALNQHGQYGEKAYRRWIQELGTQSGSAPNDLIPGSERQTPG